MSRQCPLLTGHLILKMITLGLVLSLFSYLVLGLAGTQERMRIFFAVVWLVMIFVVFIVASVNIVYRAIQQRKYITGAKPR